MGFLGKMAYGLGLSKDKVTTSGWILVTCTLFKTCNTDQMQHSKTGNRKFSSGPGLILFFLLIEAFNDSPRNPRYFSRDENV